MYPKNCGRCGSSFSKPVDIEVLKLQAKISRGAKRDRVGVVCSNRECRHYKIFTPGIKLGDKPELETEGNLGDAEYEKVMSAYATLKL